MQIEVASPARGAAPLRGVGLPVAVAIAFLAMLLVSGNGDLRGLVFWVVLVSMIALQAVVLLISERARRWLGAAEDPDDAARQPDDAAEYRVSRRAQLVRERQKNIRAAGAPERSEITGSEGRDD